MPSILFVCTGNMYRSPLLAALFYKKLLAVGQSSGWIVDSAGTWTISGKPAPPDALLAARSLGVDLQSHVTRLLDDSLLASHDLILVMEKGQREAISIEFPLVRSKLYLISEVVDQRTYDIPDPVISGHRSTEFASELSMLVERGFQKIYQLAQAVQSPQS